jgi:hypothetical protein
MEGEVVVSRKSKPFKSTDLGPVHLGLGLIVYAGSSLFPHLSSFFLSPRLDLELEEEELLLEDEEDLLFFDLLLCFLIFLR